MGPVPLGRDGVTWPVFLAACVAFSWCSVIMLWMQHEPAQAKHRRTR